MGILGGLAKSTEHLSIHCITATISRYFVHKVMQDLCHQHRSSLAFEDSSGSLPGT